jgi:hypothetical protein
VYNVGIGVSEENSSRRDKMKEHHINMRQIRELCYNFAKVFGKMEP